MNEQVLSIEQMLKLKELGVDTSNASMQWVKVDGVYRLRVCGITYLDAIDTFTLQDVLDLLTNVRYNSVGFPVLIFDYVFISKCWQITLRNPCDFNFPECKNGNPIEAAYQALVWCAENGYLKGGKQ